MRRRALAATAPLLVVLALTGCGGGDGDAAGGTGGRGHESASGQARQHEGEHEGGHEEEHGEEGEAVLGTAADRGTCRADATPIDRPYGRGFPGAWRFPPRTTAFAYEDGGASGVVVTAVSSTPFRQVLAFLNKDAVAAGFEISSGETEEHDAEASWSAGRYDGRWAIRESPTCQGETVIQVLAYPAG